MYARFCELGYSEVRPSYGAILVPLYEQDGLRIVDIANKSRISKQTMTTLARRVERAGLVKRKPDPDDGRAVRLYLTAKAKQFGELADGVVGELEQDAAMILDSPSRDEVAQWLRRYVELL